ncbi:unnamed protein product, partial [Arabidopsis lyrata]
MCSSRTYFNLTEFVSILSGIVNPNICVDVIGKIVNVIELVFVPSVEHSQGGYFELYFGLRDTECIHLECRLTGDLAVEFYDLWKRRSHNTVICIIKFVKLELPQEHRWRCTNVTGCTRIMLNPDLSITDEMLCWCIHLECRLTGDLAVEFYDLWKQHSRNTVICIIKFVKLELSQEHRWRCTNVTGSTRIMLNPDLSITDEMLC